MTPEEARVNAEAIELHLKLANDIADQMKRAGWVVEKFANPARFGGRDSDIVWSVNIWRKDIP